MMDDGPEGRLLRSNSPFSTLVGVRDPLEKTKAGKARVIGPGDLERAVRSIAELFNADRVV